MDSATMPEQMQDYAGGKMRAARSDGIGFVTFNQPEKRNAMSIEMWTGLGEILDEFEDDADIRVLVLTGAGEKAFVSGADISQFEQNRSNAAGQLDYERLTSFGRERLAAFPKPIIARIRGFCLGGGLAIAMQADLRIASFDSSFGIPAARLGIAYGFEGLKKLAQLVGPAHARMILYTARRIDAREAERIGLINHAVDAAALDATVLEVARMIADNAPLSVYASKLTIDELTKDPDARNYTAMEAAKIACFDSDDYREGRTAFMEKRRPQFQGR